MSSAQDGVLPAGADGRLEQDNSDERLFGLAASGDRQALAELVARYEKPLFGLLVRLTNGDQDRAADFFQETFLHAMRATASFNRQRQFKPWLTAIALNLVRDDARKRRSRGEVALNASAGEDAEGVSCDVVSTQEDPLAAVARRDEEEQVRQALGKLTELEREVVRLHFYQNMTLVQTAEALTVPVGTVKSRLHSALSRLENVLRRLVGKAEPVDSKQ